MEEIITKIIPKFEAQPDEDFNMWALRFEVLCGVNKVSDVVFADAMEAIGEAELSPILKDKIAKSRMILVQSLGLKALRTVAGEKKNTFKMFKELEGRYATKNVANRVQLQSQLQQTRFDASKTISEYIDAIEVLFNKLEAMESAADESMQVAILLDSFGNVDETTYGPVVSALQTLADGKLTWETAIARLLQEYNTRHAVSTSRNGNSSGKTEAGRALKSVACVGK